MKNKVSIYLKILVNYLIAIAIVLALIFVLPKTIAFLWPFLVGWIIAMIANPLVRFLEKRLKLIRKHSSAIVIITVLAAVIGLIYLLMYVLIKQGISFVNSFPELYQTVSESIQNTVDSWRNSSSVLPPSVKEFVDSIVDKSGVIINNFVKDLMSVNFTFSNAGYVVKSVAEALIMTVFTILLCYFLTADHDKIIAIYKEKMPERIKKPYEMMMDNIVYALGGYLKAQLKIMICVFIILAIGLMCLGKDYSIFIALVISLVDFLPVFGAGAIIWPWCAYEFIVGHFVSGIVLLILYVVCQAVRQFLQPKMVADSVGLSPLATIFFMFVGYRLCGVLGMIIGIPVGMIIVKFYKAGMFDNLIRGAKIMIKDLDEWRKF